MSETTPDTGTETPTETSTPDTGEDPAKEIAKWRDLARKHEERAKSNAQAVKELEELRKTTMTDQEKAAAQARLEGRTEALREIGTKLVDAEVRAAAAGRNVDVDALLEGLDRSRFIDENGDADQKSIGSWVDRIAPPPDESAGQPPAFDLGQGHRPDPSTALNGDPLLRDLKAHLGIS